MRGPIDSAGSPRAREEDAVSSIRQVLIWVVAAVAACGLLAATLFWRRQYDRVASVAALRGLFASAESSFTERRYEFESFHTHLFSSGLRAGW